MLFLFSFLESPLTFAAHLDNAVDLIKVLKNGGAHLDFRAKDGMTALHKAARSKNQITLTVKGQHNTHPALFSSVHSRRISNASLTISRTCLIKVLQHQIFLMNSTLSWNSTSR